MKHLTDQELMEIVQAGDISPGAEIYDRYSDRIYNFARGLLRNDALAAEATQETFLKVLKHANTFRARAGSSVSTWMFTIARNCCLDHLRRPENKQPKESDDALLDAPSIHDGPDRQVEQDWHASLVDEALGSLGHEVREAILLFRYREMSHAEIARVVGCSVGAAKARVFRGMELMRRYLTRKARFEPAVGTKKVTTPAATPVEDTNV